MQKAEITCKSKSACTHQLAQQHVRTRSSLTVDCFFYSSPYIQVAFEVFLFGLHFIIRFVLQGQMFSHPNHQNQMDETKDGKSEDDEWLAWEEKCDLLEIARVKIEPIAPVQPMQSSLYEGNLSQFEIISVSQSSALELALHVKYTTKKQLNTLRRILIANVPSMSLSDDESHIEFLSLPRGQLREKIIVALQQLPYAVDANLFDVMAVETTASLNSRNSLRLELVAEYPQQYDRNGKVKKYNPMRIPEEPVLSHSIRWIPENEQQLQWITAHVNNPSNYWRTNSPFFSDKTTTATPTAFQYSDYSRLIIAPHQSPHNVVRPAFEDFIITTLKPNEKLHIAFTIIKGNDIIHKKRNWSPVAPVSALPRPLVRLSQPILEIEDAQTLIAVCPRKVFAAAPAEPSGSNAALAKPRGGEPLAQQQQLVTVVNADQCIMCKACMQTGSEAVSSSVVLRDSEQEFIFKIESKGGIPVHMLFVYACDVAIGHCTMFLSTLSDSC